MKKTICIDPVDDEMAIMARALELLNKYKIFGITARKKFVDEIIRQAPEFSSRENIEKLNSFWVGRHKSPELNVVLENVLNSLADELQSKVNRLKS